MQLGPELQSELQTLIANWMKEKKPSITSAVIVVCVQTGSVSETNPSKESILDKPYHVLGLSFRTGNALNFGGGYIRRGDIKTVGDIVKLGGDGILQCRNLGIKSLLEIRTALIKHGIKLDHTWKVPRRYNQGWEPTC